MQNVLYTPRDSVLRSATVDPDKTGYPGPFRYVTKVVGNSAAEIGHG